VVQINFARRELSCKIVYYGPGMSGKTTNLEKVHELVPDDAKGRFTSIATDGDRTLFFDLLPLDVGKIGGLTIKLQLYTVPGQVYYNATRKLVLRGSDGIIFVADSHPDKAQDNLDSLKNLEENLAQYGIALSDIPLVIQYNKRDLPDAMPVDQIAAKLNQPDAPSVEATAIKGQGVIQTLKICSELVLKAVSVRATAQGAEAATTVTLGGPPEHEEAPPRKPPPKPRQPKRPAPAPERVSAVARRPYTTPVKREHIVLESPPRRGLWILVAIIAVIVVALGAVLLLKFH